MIVQSKHLQRMADPAIAPASGGAGLKAAAIPAAKPMTTETIQADLKQYLTAPKAPAEPAAEPAKIVEPATTTPPAGTEPSPEGQPADTAARSEDSEETDDDAHGTLDPVQLVNQVTKLRAQKRAIKAELEASAKAFEETLLKLKGASPAGDPSKRAEPAIEPEVPAEDRLASVPAVQEARTAREQHASAFTTAGDLLLKLGRDGRGLDEVVATLKEKHNLDFEGQEADAVESYLSKVRDNALLKYNATAAQVTVVEREAERTLGQVTHSWNQRAEELMPELKDPKSAEAQELEQVLKRLPALRHDPMGKLFAGLIIEGRKVADARTKHKAQPGAGRVAAPAAAPAGGQLPGAAASLPAAIPGVDAVEALHQAYLKNPSDETRGAWMKAVMKGRRMAA